MELLPIKWKCPNCCNEFDEIPSNHDCMSLGKFVRLNREKDIVYGRITYVRNVPEKYHKYSVEGLSFQKDRTFNVTPDVFACNEFTELSYGKWLQELSKLLVKYEQYNLLP